MTALANIIRAEILATGPLSIARYMALCLGHTQHGYYRTGTPIGRSGDFTTSPEISQLFGEMIAIWLMQAWADQGKPARFVLAELGPGRGTLMADILRVSVVNQQFSNAMQVCLVETSPTMRAAQKAALHPYAIDFIDTVDQLPQLPLFLVANEFFDALPVQQFVATDVGWQERRVAFNGTGFEFSLAKPQPDKVLSARFPDLANGKIVERSTISETIAGNIGGQITKFGGAALWIDYGNLSGTGDTFQSVKDHASTDTLKNQGQCDLTCHVQFQPLAEASDCAVQFTSQGRFLENMGITSRAQRLASGLSHADRDRVSTAHNRLVDPKQMGDLFKVMALRPQGSPELIGFENDPAPANI